MKSKYNINFKSFPFTMVLEIRKFAHTFYKMSQMQCLNCIQILFIFLDCHRALGNAGRVLLALWNTGLDSLL